jgi:hypothetical protein
LVSQRTLYKFPCGLYHGVMWGKQCKRQPKKKQSMGQEAGQLNSPPDNSNG